MGLHITARSISYSLLTACALVGIAGSSANAHDDDLRKVLDQKPPVFGEIWTQGMTVQRGGGFDSLNMTLLSHIPLNNFAPLARNGGNDCWGYVSPGGREYAIMGVEGGYGFVDITDPVNPVIVDAVGGPSSLWHDVKVVGQFAYGVSEGGSGIQVMNLSNIDSGSVNLVTNFTGGGYSTTHNIITNEDTGSLWISGANVGNGGLIHIDISNPASPVIDGGWTNMYVHDAQVATWTRPGIFQGREIAFLASGFSGGFSQTGLRIADVTDPNNPIDIKTVFYPNAGYSHQLWTSHDQKYLYLNDELDEGNGLVPSTTTRIFEISDLANAVFVGTFTTGSASVDHNLYTKGDLIFQANYRSGLRVFDAIDPTAPVEIAYFDTHPENDAASFNGAWSSYPYFPSGNIIISDIERGLFVVRLDATLPPIRATVESELPLSVDPAGGEVLTIKVLTRAGGTSISSAKLMLDTGTVFVAVDMAAGANETYSVAMPAIACDSVVAYYFAVETDAGFVGTLPINAPSEIFSTVVASSVTIAFSDNMETNTGWSVSGSATDGQWNRGNPAGDGDRGDPLVDADGSGQCYLTDNVAGNSDVDGGTTTLTSPALDASASGRAILTYNLWYSNSIGTNIDDTMAVEVSNNNGGSWVNVQSIGPGDPGSNGGWFEYSVDLSDLFATPSSQVRIRFSASDIGEGSVVEAGVDAVRIDVLECEDPATGCSAADLAEPFGQLNLQDVFAYLALFNNSDPSADLAAPFGQFNLQDVFAYLGEFNNGCP
ncbi:MAG: choice-of-anchor B family protein [Phycisphaerales bacterium]|nr:choice-of-anchor B family protein [Phycisphaerales bacterium]